MPYILTLLEAIKPLIGKMKSISCLSTIKNNKIIYKVQFMLELLCNHNIAYIVLVLIRDDTMYHINNRWRLYHIE